MNRRFLATQLAQGFGAPTTRQSFLWMAPFAPNRMTGLWHPSAFPTHHTRDCAFAPIDRRAVEAGDVAGIERLAYQFLTTYLPEDILTKTDRASMFNSRKKHGFALPVGRLIRTLFWTRCQDVLMSTDNQWLRGSDARRSRHCSRNMRRATQITAKSCGHSTSCTRLRDVGGANLQLQ